MTDNTTPAAQPATVDDTAFYSALLDRLGFIEDGELWPGGSEQNDLADERAQAVLEFLGLVRESTLPRKLLPAAKDAEIERLRAELAKTQKRASDNDGLWRKSALDVFDVCYIVGQALRRNGVEVVDPPTDERIVVAVVRQLIAEFEKARQRPATESAEAEEQSETIRRWRDAEGHVWVELEPGKLTDGPYRNVPYLEVVQGWGPLTEVPTEGGDRGRA